ncbi:MAG: hypothetical protein MRZ79_27745 [Bacteroidia bacterium]|nr:hypothetical protein [Bacteroidia bacterium]
MNLLKQILWGILSFVLTMLFCEAFIWSSNIANVSFSDFDPEIGKVNRQDVPFLIFNEGMGVGKYNAYGYLGKEYPPYREDNTLRLALMGDSYVAGLQVMGRHHFRSILEKGLSENLGSTVEALNFGKPGFDLPDMYAFKENYIDRFTPDLYLIFVAEFDFYPKVTDVLVPDVKLENGELAIDMDFPEEAVLRYNQIKVPPQHSTILNMMNNGLKKTKQVPLGSILLDKVYTWIWEEPELGEDHPGATGEKVISDVVKAIIGDLDKEKVVFINRDMEALSPEIVELLVGFKYIDLSPHLQKMKLEGKSPIDWPITGRVGHWNHEGHKLVAKVLEEELASSLR